MLHVREVGNYRGGDSKASLPESAAGTDRDVADLHGRVANSMKGLSEASRLQSAVGEAGPRLRRQRRHAHERSGG